MSTRKRLAMFIDSAKDIYDKYHSPETAEAGKEYYYKCLKTREDIGVEREKASYYLKRIDLSNKEKAVREANNHE